MLNISRVHKREIYFTPASPPPPPPQKIMRKVRRWGDPVMTQYGFDVNQVGTSNFQAVRCYNKETGFGAVTNWLYIPHVEVMNLWNMQIEDNYATKNKMNWLCSYRGSLYMYDRESDDWQTAAQIRWGTLTLGGNVVQVERYETIRTIFGTTDNKYLQDVQMARLVGFKPLDWTRPLSELLMDGLVHRVYCAYFPENGFGDSPKGVVYSPFYSPQAYDFGGTKKPDALYLPVVWLEDL